MPLSKQAVLPETGPPFPPDRLARRLLGAVLVSALVNLAVWRIAAQVVSSHLLTPPPSLTFRRVILPPVPKPPKKVVRKIVRPKPKPKRIVKPKPVIHPRIVRQVTRPVPTAPPRPAAHPKPAPPAAHHRILTAEGPAPTRPTAQVGGHAALGQPILHQNPGEGHDNNQPPPPQPPPRPVPQPQPTPQPTPQPKPRPILPPPVPPPAGPTQDAEPSNQIKPDIPEELKTGDYKSHVRVKVDIQADGSFVSSLITSSGNTEIDRRVLEALKRWRWKPALESGKPVRSTQRFRFDFEVD